VTFVIDASVAFKWFVSDEEDAEAAAALLRSESTLIAPDILVAEVSNTLWRSVRIGRIPPEQAMQGAVAVSTLFEVLIGSAVLAPRALAIARALDHPVYDCLYLALAEARQARLVTADMRFLTSLNGTVWEQNALPLAQYSTGA
jgi:predicted nucleic acid-binding protein